MYIEAASSDLWMPTPEAAARATLNAMRWLLNRLQVRIVNIGPVWVTRQMLDEDPIEIWRSQVLHDGAYCRWAEDRNPSFRNYCDVDLRASFAQYAMYELARIRDDLAEAKK